MSKCDFCLCPGLAARFRLMEAAYHEDMKELYERLEKLEMDRPEARMALPPVHLRRKIDRFNLACSLCRHFGVEDETFWCERQNPNFPGLCEEYEHVVR